MANPSWLKPRNFRARRIRRPSLANSIFLTGTLPTPVEVSLALTSALRSFAQIRSLIYRLAYNGYVFALKRDRRRGDPGRTGNKSSYLSPCLTDPASPVDSRRFFLTQVSGNGQDSCFPTLLARPVSIQMQALRSLFEKQPPCPGATALL